MCIIFSSISLTVARLPQSSWGSEMNNLSKLLDQALNEIEASSGVQMIGADETAENLLAPLPYEVQAEFELLKENTQMETAAEVLKKFLEGCDVFVDAYNKSNDDLTQMMRGKPLSDAQKQAFLERNRAGVITSITKYLIVSGMAEATAEAIAKELIG